MLPQALYFSKAVLVQVVAIIQRATATVVQVGLEVHTTSQPNLSNELIFNLFLKYQNGTVCLIIILVF